MESRFQWADWTIKWGYRKRRKRKEGNKFKSTVLHPEILMRESYRVSEWWLARQKEDDSTMQMSTIMIMRQFIKVFIARISHRWNNQQWTKRKYNVTDTLGYLAIQRPRPAGRGIRSMGPGFFPNCGFRNKRGRVFSSYGCLLRIPLK